MGRWTGLPLAQTVHGCCWASATRQKINQKHPATRGKRLLFRCAILLVMVVVSCVLSIQKLYWSACFALLSAEYGRDSKSKWTQPRVGCLFVLSAIFVGFVGSVVSWVGDVERIQSKKQAGAQNNQDKAAIHSKKGILLFVIRST